MSSALAKKSSFYGITRADEQPPKGVCSIRLLAQQFMFIYDFISESIAHPPSLAQTKYFLLFADFEISALVYINNSNYSFPFAFLMPLLIICALAAMPPCACLR